MVSIGLEKYCTAKIQLYTTISSMHVAMEFMLAPKWLLSHEIWQGIPIPLFCVTVREYKHMTSNTRVNQYSFDDKRVVLKG